MYQQPGPPPLPPPRNRAEREYQQRYYAHWGLQPPTPPKRKGNPGKAIGIIVAGLLVLWVWSVGNRAISTTTTTGTPDSRASLAATNVASNATPFASSTSVVPAFAATLPTPVASPSPFAGIAATPTLSATISNTPIPTPVAAPTMQPCPNSACTAKPGQRVAVVSADGANLRADANMGAMVLALLPGNTVGTVAERGAVVDGGGTGWVQVAVDGQTGFVRADLLSGPDVPITQPTATVFMLASSTYADYPVVDAADLTKRPDGYKGRKFSIVGKAFNVRESGGLTTFQVWAEPYDYRYPVVVAFRGNDRTLRDDIRLRVYGVGLGSTSGTNSFGATILQPSMTAEYTGPPTDATNEATANAYDRGRVATYTAIAVGLDRSRATVAVINVDSTKIAVTANANSTRFAATFAVVTQTAKARP